MKKTLINGLTILLFLFVLLGTAIAAPFNDSEYKAGEFQVDALAIADTANLKDYDAAGGVALTYWHWQTVGIGAELKTFNTDHAVFDNIGLNLAARYPLKLATPFAKIGFDWNAEQEGARAKLAEWEVYVGLGVEKRFSLGSVKNLSIGAEVRGVRAAKLAPDEHLQGIVRLGKTF